MNKYESTKWQLCQFCNDDVACTAGSGLLLSRALEEHSAKVKLLTTKYA